MIVVNKNPISAPAESVYINLDKRADRKVKIEKRLIDAGINTYRIQAVSSEELTTNDLSGWKLSKAQRATVKSHLKAIEYAMLKKFPYIIIFEDDTILCDNFKDKLENLLRGVPLDWSLLYLGCSEFRPFKPVNGYCSRVTPLSAYGAYGYVVKSSLYTTIHKLLKNPTTTVDDTYCEKIVTSYPCYAASPMLCCVEDDYSDINKTYRDLTYLRKSFDSSYKPSINVIISAFDCAEYIEECLDSIMVQTTKVSKILLGIDGCPDTLQKVLSIKHKYNGVLELFNSDINTGPYCVFNYLLKEVSDEEYVVFFGADDVMSEVFIEQVSKGLAPKVANYDGILFIQKKLLKTVGGFRDWRCAADTDILNRLEYAGITITDSRFTHFFRREHAKQLTAAAGTSMGSELRKSYRYIIDAEAVAETKTTYIEPTVNTGLYKVCDKPVSVNIATYPPRKALLIKCLTTLSKIKLLSNIRVYLNGYDFVPNDLKSIDSRITFLTGGKDLKDNGKFFWAGSVDEYYFSADDDLYYTEKYFHKHIKFLEAHGNNYIVTAHGHLFNKESISLDCPKESYHCLHTTTKSAKVHSGGTGVMLIDSGKFPIPMSIFEQGGMADLYVAKYAKEKDVPIICRKHDSKEVILIDPTLEDTLYNKRATMAEAHKVLISNLAADE